MKAQLLTIPVYVSGCFSTIAFGVISDRAHVRGPFVTGLSFLGIVGYILLLATDPETQPQAGYAATFFVAAGCFPGISLTLAWSAGNAGASLKKATILALIGMVGNLGGICSSFVYRTQDPPRFRLGHSVVMGFLGMTFFGSLFATLLYRRLNLAIEQSPTEKNTVFR
ncbi:hypothetical protein DFH07DRAFT_962833 [Mycena maculata]|uniref:MFS general substrate transporter n=1 Tax=Mycena maculata TaxID=230809 RepID=A0AAD7IQJ6_9AGAR|nr:hypothetical protein DFH07DRAFT_962833 [Mycena maculata]